MCDTYLLYSSSSVGVQLAVGVPVGVAQEDDDADSSSAGSDLPWYVLHQLNIEQTKTSMDVGRLRHMLYVIVYHQSEHCRFYTLINGFAAFVHI